MNAADGHIEREKSGLEVEKLGLINKRGNVPEKNAKRRLSLL